MLTLYREGLAPPPHRTRGRDGELRWLPSSESVLAFARGENFICLVNFGPDAVDLPSGAGVLLASSELEGGALPHDSTVWLRQAESESRTGPGPDRITHRCSRKGKDDEVHSYGRDRRESP